MKMPFDSLAETLAADSLPGADAVLAAIRAAKKFAEESVRRPPLRTAYEFLCVPFRYERKCWGVMASEWERMNKLYPVAPKAYFDCMEEIAEEEVADVVLSDLIDRNLHSTEWDRRKLCESLPSAIMDKSWNKSLVVPLVCRVVTSTPSMLDLWIEKCMPFCAASRADGVWMTVGCLVRLACELTWHWTDEQTRSRSKTFDKMAEQFSKIADFLRENYLSEGVGALSSIYGIDSELIDKEWKSVVDFGIVPVQGHYLEWLLLARQLGYVVPVQDGLKFAVMSLVAGGRVSLSHLDGRSMLAFEEVAKLVCDHPSPEKAFKEMRKAMGAVFYRLRMQDASAGAGFLAWLSYFNLSYVVLVRLRKVCNQDTAFNAIRAQVENDGKHLVVNPIPIVKEAVATVEKIMTL